VKKFLRNGMNADMSNVNSLHIHKNNNLICIPLSQVITFMDFVSDVSTLYKVEPGPEFRLVASNSTAQKTGAGPLSYHGRLLKDLLPQNYYETLLLPEFERVIQTMQPNRFNMATPFPGSVDVMDSLLSPIIENGECTHIWVMTKKRYLEQTLEYFAFHDSLTGVANRRFLHQRIMKSISRNCQHGIKFTVMMLDCDYFKQVNDSLGHQFGDELLRCFADRLTETVKNGLVARLGGDEFAILLEQCDTYATASDMAERIHHAWKDPWNIKGHVIDSTSSIGVVLVDGQQSVEEILFMADQAMYEAKNNGRDQYVIHQYGFNEM